MSKLKPDDVVYCSRRSKIYQVKRYLETDRRVHRGRWLALNLSDCSPELLNEAFCTLLTPTQLVEFKLTGKVESLVDKRKENEV